MGGHGQVAQVLRQLLSVGRCSRLRSTGRLHRSRAGASAGSTRVGCALRLAQDNDLGSQLVDGLAVVQRGGGEIGQDAELVAVIVGEGAIRLGVHAPARRRPCLPCAAGTASREVRARPRRCARSMIDLAGLGDLGATGSAPIRRRHVARGSDGPRTARHSSWFVVSGSSRKSWPRFGPGQVDRRLDGDAHDFVGVLEGAQCLVDAAQAVELADPFLQVVADLDPFFEALSSRGAAAARLSARSTDSSISLTS